MRKSLLRHLVIYNIPMQGFLIRLCCITVIVLLEYLDLAQDWVSLHNSLAFTQIPLSRFTLIAVAMYSHFRVKFAK